jgi:hypothetical protein
MEKKRPWRTVRNEQITEEYRRVEKTGKIILRKAKRKFQKKLAFGGEANGRSFYAYVKQKTKKQ